MNYSKEKLAEAKTRYRSAMKQGVNLPASCRRVAVCADGIILNGLRYQHCALESHINKEAMVSYAKNNDGINVFVGNKFVCTAKVQLDIEG